MWYVLIIHFCKWRRTCENMNYEISNNNNNEAATTDENWRAKNQNKAHLFENNHFLCLSTLDESLLGMVVWLHSILFLYHFSRSFLSRLHLEICSRLEMSYDFMRYLFCGLVLGDKRWQDFICILVCVSSSSSSSPTKTTASSLLSCVTRRCVHWKWNWGMLPEGGVKHRASEKKSSF